jgi:tetratricopeptide (TPR) repeat protein
VRVAGAGTSGADARWRVFVSHTSELRDFPAGRSYLAAVKRAVSAAGHVIVDMDGFPAADQPPAELCADLVRGCDVYLGVLGTQYGSPVRDRPEVSYTELEFDTATGAALDRLVFLLDTGADVGIPPSALIDRETGDRQDAFRNRVQDSELTTQSFSNPDMLALLVERSLRELADTRARIGSGIAREHMPTEPQPVQASKSVNPPPAVAPTWFQDRKVETGLLGKYVTDPAIAMVCVAGRGGIGKTAMVCRLLKDLEAGRIPDVEGDQAAISVGGIVYLSRNGAHQVGYPTLVADLLRLLPAEVAHRLGLMYQDPHHTPTEMMLGLLEAFPAGEPVVVLLDNLESVMDIEAESLAEPALGQALAAVLTAPAHAVTVIATTRVMPTALVKVEPARQRQLRLEEGLRSPDAEKVLRELDDDGRLGLRDAPDELLDGLRAHTRGFPRALEAVKAILDGDLTLTPQDLLDRTRSLPEDQVVQVLVGEAYDLLDAAGKQVMRTLSVYPAPVPAVGVDFLLRPVNPVTDAAPILARLVRRQLVRFHDGLYHLHPVDRDYARSQLPRGSPGDSPAGFTLTGLQARAADYYSQIRPPPESRRALEDIQPQLAEFELRCDIGDYDIAASVLQDIDFACLQLWGHYRTAVDMHARIHGRVTHPAANAVHMANLGLCCHRLGDYRQAIDLHTQALAMARDIGDRQLEAAELAGLGNCHFRVGDYRQAIDFYSEALAIARDIDDRESEAIALGGLGKCDASLGEYRQAIDLHAQALAMARDIGDRQREGNQLGNLGNCHFDLGDYRQAIDLYSEALAIARHIGDRQRESAELGNLGNCRVDLGDYRQAIDLYSEALAIAHDIGARRLEGMTLGYLGNCYTFLGEYRQAIDLQIQALAIARDIGDRYAEATTLDYLGRAWLASGDEHRAVTLLLQAVKVADTTGNIEPMVRTRSGLARALLQLGDQAGVLAAVAAVPELSYPIEEPTLRLLEGLALLELNRPDESARAFTSVLTATDALVALADSNVAAVQARALALAGLATATSDPARASEAVEAFTQARTITSAAGVAADTQHLLKTIIAQDQSGVLAELSAAQDLL